ncbi:alpha/beta hydrolase [Enterococcus camelliae]|uniref:Alpha/beta hydrolase n=1 Tax=Enterococcus camelliae TaxID=453959 RepID=A0ABW5THX7_9ENTE
MQIETMHLKGYETKIILPSGYHEQYRYPVIYLHDGGNGAIQVLNQIEHLIQSKQIAPIILVGVTPINRNDDYTPWPADAMLPNQPQLGGKAALYLDTLVQTIKPAIDTHFSTNPLPEATTIAGCSFGGLVSFFASYYASEIFGNYIFLSASFWYEHALDYLNGQTFTILEKRYQKPTVVRANQRLFLYVGEIEGIYRQTNQKYMLDYNKKAFELLKNEGFDKKAMKLMTDPEGTHDAYYFAKYFLEALKWLFPSSEKQE